MGKELSPEARKKLARKFAQIIPTIEAKKKEKEEKKTEERE